MAGRDFIILALIAVGVLNSPFAIGVYRDAKKRSPLLAPAEAWAAMTVVGGILVVVAYWLMHLSTLARTPEGVDETRLRTA